MGGEVSPKTGAGQTCSATTTLVVSREADAPPCDDDNGVNVEVSLMAIYPE